MSSQSAFRPNIDQYKTKRIHFMRRFKAFNNRTFKEQTEIFVLKKMKRLISPVKHLQSLSQRFKKSTTQTAK